jgi:hypothetical protein
LIITSIAKVTAAGTAKIITHTISRDMSIIAHSRLQKSQEAIPGGRPGRPCTPLSPVQQMVRNVVLRRGGDGSLPSEKCSLAAQERPGDRLAAVSRPFPIGLAFG